MKPILDYEIMEILRKLRKDEWIVFKTDRISLEGNNYSAEFIVEGNLLRVDVKDHNKDLVEQYEKEIYKETAPRVLEELVEEISLAVKDLSCDHIKDNKGAPFSSEYNSLMITLLLGKLGLSCRKVSSLISDNLTYFSIEIFGEKFNAELSNGLLVIRDYEGKARAWGEVEDILAVKSLHGVDLINVGALAVIGNCDEGTRLTMASSGGTFCLGIDCGKYICSYKGNTIFLANLTTAKTLVVDVRKVVRVHEVDEVILVSNKGERITVSVLEWDTYICLAVGSAEPMTYSISDLYKLEGLFKDNCVADKEILTPINSTMLADEIQTAGLNQVSPKAILNSFK